MSFDSITEIIKFFEQQPSWESVRQYRLVLDCWKTVVSPEIACQTRPLFINRQVLWVATSSSAWAQNLSLQRYSLLKKLNAKLPEVLADIRFSPASWYNSPQTDSSDRSTPVNLREEHPSFVNNAEDLTRVDESATSPESLQDVFQRWVQKKEQIMQQLPLCPRCSAPTPVGELQRWSVCSCCAVNQWSLEKK